MELQHWKDKFGAHRPTLQGARGEYAVLVPLLDRPDGWHLLYEVRAAALHHQPGEVCFPGGKMEPGESPLDCALRETREELGVTPDQIEVLGQPDFVLRGQSIVYPILACLRIDEPSTLPIGPDEVAEVFAGCGTIRRSTTAGRYPSTLLTSPMRRWACPPAIPGRRWASKCRSTTGCPIPCGASPPASPPIWWTH